MIKRYNRNLFSAIAIAAITMLSACHSEEDTSKKKGADKSNSMRAEGFVVKTQAFLSSYSASGSLLPNEEIDIHAEVSGRVTKILFTEGSFVRKGDLLVQLYDADIKAQLQKSISQKELQEKIKERQAGLLKIGGISQQDFETTTAQIQSIDADIAYSESQLRKTKIIAPFNGRIGIRDISVGAIISPTTPISSLQQIKLLKMDFTVPEQYRANLDTGKEVFFMVTGNLDTLKGTIAAIDPGADANTRTIRVRAIVSNEDKKLVAGSFAQVLIPFENKATAILIPSQSVIPTTRDKQVALIKDGKAKMQTILTGTRTNDMVEIVHGLNPGDTILTTGIMQVKNGMSVKITKV